ncbi:MAG: methyltransferase [Cyanobacteria bacterium P01_G01_bin.39]
MVNTTESTDILNQTPPQIAMLEMASSYWLSQCIYVAAKLGIADLLKEGAKSCDTLAAATATHRDSLYRLLRALASAGIFAETEPNCYELTPLAVCLQSDVPESIRATCIMLGEEHYQAWGNVMHSVKTGGNAFEQRYNMPIFQYYRQNPLPAKIFEQAMSNGSVIENGAISKAYDFSSIGKLVDVGGGYGSLIAVILQHNPAMTGVLFDEPYMIEKAEETSEISQVKERCQLVGGNFFESVPAGADAYLLKRIIHDWDDEKAIKILQNCHQAMGEKGRLLIIELVIPPENNMGSFFLDMHMLVLTPGGRERTQTQYRELLKAAGFKLTKIVPTQSGYSLIEGVPSRAEKSG